MMRAEDPAVGLSNAMVTAQHNAPTTQQEVRRTKVRAFPLFHPPIFGGVNTHSKHGHESLDILFSVEQPDPGCVC
jgi:hypothetical protein